MAGGWVPSLSTSAKPSDLGICTSRKTRSGCCVFMTSRASAVDPHCAMISSSGSLASSDVNRMRASGSSSTIKTLRWRVVLQVGDADEDDGSSFGSVGDGERLLIAIEATKSRPRVADADTFSCLVFMWEACSVVFDPDVESTLA